MTNQPAPDLSVVIPVHNEADNIGPLIEEVRRALAGLVTCEVVVVDDASSDATPERLDAIARSDPALRIVRHSTNAGQSTALLTGVRFSRAPLVATLDGDGQNDPADIPKLLGVWRAHPRAAAVLVTGHRVSRRDSRITRISSRVANAVRARLLGDHTPDTACGLKVFSRDLFLALPYFDHMHRFLPALVLRAGGEVVSVGVSHRPRRGGRSHYGVHNRLWAGIVDLAGVMWLIRRARRPEAAERTPR